MAETELEYGGTLEASATDPRVVSGLLIPYGVTGRTNLGALVLDAAATELPVDPAGTIGLNVGHDRTNPVGRAVSLEPRPEGLYASFRIADGEAGDEALEGVTSGRRKGLSVEADIRGIKAGRALFARVFGAALVERPAFPGAMLLAADANPDPNITEETTETTETAPDGSTVDTKTTTTEELEDLGDGVTRVTRTIKTVTDTTPGDTPPVDPNQPVLPAEGVASVPTTTPATVPPSLMAQYGTGARTAPHTEPETPKGITAGQLFAALAEAHRSGNRELLDRLQDEGRTASVLYGALTDITATSGVNPIGTTVQQPQWIGEVWAGRTYQRRYIPLFGSKNLTGFGISGFRWTTKPGVGPWSGNKTSVPSTGAAVEPFEREVQGLAGANDIDRRYRDFSVPGFWESYFRFMTDSYSKQSDEGVFATVLADAPRIIPGAVPAGINAGLAAIVDGALAVLDEGTPTFSVVAKDVWRDILLTPKDKVTEYLNSSLGLEEGRVDTFRIIPARAADLPAGATLTGIGSAADAYELPGAPIRVEGLDMAKGGIDPGVFGYYGAVTLEPAAFAYTGPVRVGVDD